MKKKILQLNKFYYPEVGGIEKIVKQIAENIPNIEVLTCVKKGKGKTEIINNVCVMRCCSFGVLWSMPISFSFLYKFAKICNNYNTIILHLPFPLSDLSVLLSNFKGKIILWWHSDIIRQKKILWLYKPILIKLLNRADKIIVASEFHINSSEFLPNFANKCEIIPYGIKIDENQSSGFQILLSNDKNKLKILFSGRLVYYKGVEFLIKAFENVSGAELFVVGSGVLKEKLVNMASKNKNGDNIHFLNKISDDEIKNCYKNCDIFVLPSVENSEAFGLVQLEAMAFGKPVINTFLPTAVPFVSINGETGITVPPKNAKALTNAMQKLIDDNNLRLKLGINAKNRVLNHFSEQIMIEKLKKLINIC